MKLKNKRSGEIKEFVLFDGKNELQGGATLKDLVKDWEDVPEEPKEFWYIENDGDIDKETYDGDDYEKRMIKIGNYFSSREEAELAVRKLKAWKRLRDKGFKFSEWEEGTKNYKVIITGILPKGLLDDERDNDDLGLLFGGEE